MIKIGYLLKNLWEKINVNQIVKKVESLSW